MMTCGSEAVPTIRQKISAEEVERVAEPERRSVALGLADEGRDVGVPCARGR